MSVMKTILRNTAGMTVAEVIIALGVIVIGLLALIATMPLGTSAIAESNLKTTATFLAQQRLERLKNAQWTSATDELGGAGSNGSAVVSVAGFADRWPDEAYNTVAEYPRFRRQVRIQDCSVAPRCVAAVAVPVPPTPDPLATMRQVTVTVFFFPLTGPGTTSATEESLRLVTLIAQRP
jgi:Tfp pilus assembly protein PilE